MHQPENMGILYNDYLQMSVPECPRPMIAYRNSTAVNAFLPSHADSYNPSLLYIPRMK